MTRILVVLALALGVAMPTVAAAQAVPQVKVQPKDTASKMAPHMDKYESPANEQHWGVALMFWGIALVTVGGALFVVSRRNLIAAVMGMVGSFLGIAAVYMMLYASFLAVIQMLVYAGAIMVLFVFVIMLLNAGAETIARPVRIGTRVLGILLLAAFLGVISFIIQAMLPKTEGVVFGDFTGGTAAEVGKRLFTAYLLPFEVTSVLILIAIVGAIVLARKEI